MRTAGHVLLLVLLCLLVPALSAPSSHVGEEEEEAAARKAPKPSDCPAPASSCANEGLTHINAACCDLNGCCVFRCLRRRWTCVESCWID